MASPDEQLLSESDDVVHKSDNVNDMPSDVQIGESQLHEVVEGNIDSSQLGDQEVVSETQFDERGPGSDPTDEAMVVETEHADVSHKEHYETDISNEEVHSDGITLLKRPDSAGKASSQPAFSFGRPGRLSMDFTRTRKGPTPSIVQSIEGTYCPSQNSTAATYNVVSMAANQVPKQKRKGCKLQRYHTASEQPLVDHDVPPVGEEPSRREAVKTRKIIQEDNAAASGSQRYTQRSGTENGELNIEEDQNITAPRSQNSNVQYQSQTDDYEARNSPTRSEGVQSGTHSAQASTQHSSPSRPEMLHSEGRHDIRNTPPRSDPALSLHQVSSQHGSSRVVKPKPKSKPSRRATEGHAAGSQALKNPLPEINDYMQILWHKAKQLESYYAEKFADEVENLETERQQILDSKAVLQSELQNASQEKETLTATLKQQNTKLALLETQVKKFRSYMKGLGNDFDALKQEAMAREQRREELAKETEAHQADREALWQEMNLRTEAAATLRKETFAKLAESEQSLRDAGVQSKYLEQQLSQTVGLLAEERDRCSRLESQLGQERDRDDRSEDKTIESIKASEEAVLNKLSQIYRLFLGDDKADGISSTLMDILGQVQAMSAQSDTTGKDISLAKCAIEKLSESIAEHLSSSAIATDPAPATSFQAWLDEALNALKGELQQYEGRIQQQAAHEERAKTLQEKLEKSNEQIATAKVEVSSAKAREIQLKEENATLRARITALHTNATSTDGSSAQLHGATSTLDENVRTLENTKTVLAKKEAELSSLSLTNDNLRDQIRTLEKQLGEMQNAIADLAAEKEEALRKVAAEREQDKKETAEHVEKYEAEVRNRVGNELKKITSERNRFEKQLNPVAEELTNCKARIAVMEKDPRRRDDAKDLEVERLNSLVESQREELKTLNTFFGDRESSTEGMAALKKDLSALAAQYEDHKQKALRLTEEKAAVTKQLEVSTKEADAAKAAKDEAGNELNRYRSETEKSIKALEKDLAEKREAVERSAAGYSRFKKSCDDAVQEEKNRSQRHIKDLQDRLAEAQIEAQQAKEADEKFREDVEQSWRSNVQEHENKIAEIEAKAAQADTEKSEALQENERLRKEQQKATDEKLQALTEQLNDALKRATIAENKLQNQQQHSDETSKSSSRIYVPRIGDDVTPAASLHSTAPTKPRKKVNRDSNTVLEDDPVPAPQELRPDSRRTSSGKSNARRGAVVEESQITEGSYRKNNTNHIGPTSTIPPFTDSDDILPGDDSERRLPDVVDETQSQDRLPLFAAFNSSIDASSQLQHAQAGSFGFSVPALQNSQFGGQYHGLSRGQNQYAGSQSLQDTSYTFGRQPDESFQIFEDSPHSNTQTQRKEVEDSQETRPLSQFEEDAFTYRKPFAHPNSASKIVHRAAGAAGTMRHRSDSTRQSVDRDNVSNGSAGRQPAKRSPVQHVYTAENTRSSTPDWMHTNMTQNRGSYNTPGNSGGKRRSSRTKSGLIADPRLANRDPPVPPKRKLSGQITTGYEPERKKRLSSDLGTSTEHSRHFSSQGRSQRSDQSSFPTMHSGPTNAQYQRPGPKAQSRMKTLAGGSSRTTRGVRQPSKNAEYNARFNQELSSC